jgi:TatD DNase family protein
VTLVDSHCHLDDEQFNEDREAVIARAQAAGVVCMLTIGTGNGPPDIEGAVRLAERYPFVYATAGVHPNDAEKVNHGAQANTFAHLERLLGHPKVKAVGEIGLDYHWQVPRQVQLPVFVRQLDIAATARMPIIIHTRDAFDDTIQVLKAHWSGANLPCVMHCFTGSPAQAAECLDLGFYLAFGGVSTFPKASEVRESARLVPADRLLLETDCPYLAPVPYRGKRNEPAYVAHTAKTIAELRGVTPEDLARQTTFNFTKIFGIDLASQSENQSGPVQPLH